MNGAVGTKEGLLDRIFGAARREQATAVAEEWPPIALDYRLKGWLVTGPGKLEQPFIRLASEQGRDRKANRVESHGLRHL